MRHLFLVLVLAGCSDGTHLDSSRWVCTKIGEYTERELVQVYPAMEAPVRRTGCVQWTRITAAAR